MTGFRTDIGDNICPHCGAVLPADAKFCDICGEACDSPQHRAYEKKKNRPFILLATAITALMIISQMWLSISVMILQKNSSLSGISATIDADKYNRIEIGMSLDEVTEIIGGEGLLYSSEFNNYRWPGLYYDDEFQYDSYAEFTFDDEGILRHKEEYDILSAEEIKKFTDICYDYPEKIEAPIVTRKQLSRLEEGMRYSEIVNLLGGEGMLASEDSSVRWTEEPEKGYSSYAYRCKRDGKDSHVRISIRNDRLAFVIDDSILRSID